MISAPPKKPISPSKKDSGPAPPPLPPAVKNAATAHTGPKSPIVASTGPPGAFMVELLTYNGSPFKDHWAYWVCSHNHLDIGVLIHATGDVKNGFIVEIKRWYNLTLTTGPPTSRIPLQWIHAKEFSEKAMFNNGTQKIDHNPVCNFEASLCKIKPPGKTLNAVDNKFQPAQKIKQKNCQTWIVESADQLVKDHIFNNEVASYLHAIEQ